MIRDEREPIGVAMVGRLRHATEAEEAEDRLIRSDARLHRDARGAVLRSNRERFLHGGSSMSVRFRSRTTSLCHRDLPEVHRLQHGKQGSAHAHPRTREHGYDAWTQRSRILKWKSRTRGPTVPLTRGGSTSGEPRRWRTKKGNGNMQNITLTLLVLIGIATCAVGQSNTAYTTVIGPLLTTQWGQRGVYAKLTPGAERTGCWAAALAQILYYHRVQPSGEVTFWYEGGQSNTVVKLNHQFDWSLFVDSISNSTPAASQDEVALYCYYTFLAINENDNAPTNSAPKPAFSDLARPGLDKYFNSSTWPHRSGAPGGFEALRKEVMSELAAKRPLMLYAPPHAFVIDGARVGEKGFEVHMNCGWGGTDNGWYLFEEPFNTHFGPLGGTARWVLTIHPRDVAMREAAAREAAARDRETAAKAREAATKAREAAAAKRVSAAKKSMGTATNPTEK